MGVVTNDNIFFNDYKRINLYVCSDLGLRMDDGQG